MVLINIQGLSFFARFVARSSSDLCPEQVRSDRRLRWSNTFTNARSLMLSMVTNWSPTHRKVGELPASNPLRPELPPVVGRAAFAHGTV
ncbi:hypothetical protein EVAR_14502_1 [Eumeta japonica]|uniref:Uncharacterized protein n=1 Tax=Eumeta variegata TaxID=151549 RepID=A0A4C1U4M2_EUMVA|nr:hypothetical protein EVAR_14502_1 [Eumeta japonica]